MTRPPRWHIWSTVGWYETPPRPVPPELWKTLRDRQHVTSPDGLWREYHDDNDNPILVMVKL